MKCGRFSTIYLMTSLVATSAVFAHKPVSVRYNFEAHVRPIFEEHCGGCDRRGGPTPMARLSFYDARPWAVAIKEQVLTQRMPLW